MTKDPMLESGRTLAAAVSIAQASLRYSDAGDRRSALLELLALEEAASSARRSLVAELRVMGASWPHLGELLNISKQGAAKVYGDDAERLLSTERRHFRAQLDAESATQVVAGEQLDQVKPSAPVALPAQDVPLELVQLTAITNTTGQLTMVGGGRVHLVTSGPRAIDPDAVNEWAWDVPCELCDAERFRPCTTLQGSAIEPELQKDGTWYVWTHATRRGYDDPDWSWTDRQKPVPVTVEGVQSVPCSSCGAAAGASCTTRTGAQVKNGKQHEARWNAFLRP